MQVFKVEIIATGESIAEVAKLLVDVQDAYNELHVERKSNVRPNPPTIKIIDIKLC